MKKTVKINMRELADLAGVSAMTVSRAIKNSPGIKKETRLQILKLAQENGYTINPLVSAQMANIRARRLIKYQATIGLLIHSPPQGVWIGAQQIIEGVIETSASMGFKCDTFDLANKELTPKRLNEILKSRGIRSLIEAPMIADLTQFEIDDSELIIISTNPGALPQTFHRVCPDHYSNMDMLLRKVKKHGFRRPGLMIPHDIDRRLNYLWTSRYLAFQQTENFGKIPPHIPQTTADFSIDAFRAWFKRYKPDILITTSQELFEKSFFEKANLAIPQDIEVLKININDTRKGFSGVNLRSRDIGASCVRLLSQLMYQNEFGKPENPISMLVPGVWTSGKMAPSLDAE